MYPKVKEESPKTKAYLIYVFEELLKNKPLQPGELIEVRITENITPFPTLFEMPAVPDSKEKINPEFYDETSEKMLFHSDQVGAIKSQTDDNAARPVLRMNAVVWYTITQLSEMCKWVPQKAHRWYPLDITYRTIIVDRDKIYKRAEELGIKTSDEEIHIKKAPSSPPIFVAKVSKLIWDGKEVAVGRNSMEFDICRYALKQKPHEFILWSDAMKKVDRQRLENKKKSWRATYDAIGRINKKTKEVVGKPLFKWEERGFSRVE